MFDISENAANVIYTLSNVAVIVGAILTVIGAIGLFWSGGVRDRFSAIKFSNNVAATAEANKEAARANEQAGLANERAANLEKSAAADRLELALLKQKSAPWKFSQNEANAFFLVLKAAPKCKVVIEYSSVDAPRSSDFSKFLKETLTDNGYDVWGYIGPFTSAGDTPLVGIELSIKNQSIKEAELKLQQAFQAIGIEPKLTQRNQQDTTFGDDTVVISIGIKPEISN